MEFKITNNNNTFLFDEPVANTGDMVPMLNVMPMGVCTVTSSPCVPAPIMWDGFEDGIFVGFFNPLLEDSVLPCGVGGKIEIYYSLEEATAACAEEGGGFWETLGKVVLVVAAVALIVVTGGMAIAAIGAIAAASGALATGIAVTVAALEVAGCLLTVKALYDYSQDGDEEALFKEVALGFLFLGVGKAVEKGFRMWKAGRAVDDVVEVVDDAVKGADEVVDSADDVIKVVDDIPPWKGATDYSDIDVSKFKIKEGANFTQAQKKAIYEANMKHNDGLLRSDMDGSILEKAAKSEKGVTPPPNEAQIDHIRAKSKGGTNDPSENAQVLSRKQNRDKWDG